MNRQELLTELKENVLKSYPESRVILYGSRSRGDNDIYSDWDVLIVVDEDLEESKKIEMHNNIYEIELRSGEIINSIIHSKREWNNPMMESTPFFRNVQKEGISI